MSLFRTIRFLCFFLHRIFAYNIIDVDDILSDNLMPGNLLVLEKTNLNETFLKEDNFTKGSFDEALLTMDFHRSKINEYLCRSFIAEEIISKMSVPKISRRSGGANPLSIKEDMLLDEGSKSYKDWLLKSTTLEDIYRHYNSKPNESISKKTDEEDEEYDTHVTNYVYEQPAKHTTYNLYGTTGYQLNYPHQNYHQSNPQNGYGSVSIQSYEPSHSHHDNSPKHNKEKDLTDLFDIALTALAYLSFGMFIIHVIMCISAVTNTATTAVTMMPMNMGPAGPEPTGEGMTPTDDGMGMTMTGNDGDMGMTMTGNGGDMGMTMTGDGGDVDMMTMTGNGGGGDMTSPGDTGNGDGGDMTSPGDTGNGDGGDITSPGDNGGNDGGDMTSPGDNGNGDGGDVTSPGDNGGDDGGDMTSPGDNGNGDEGDMTSPGDNGGDDGGDMTSPGDNGNGDGGDVTSPGDNGGENGGDMTSPEDNGNGDGGDMTSPGDTGNGDGGDITSPGDNGNGDGDETFPDDNPTGEDDSKKYQFLTKFLRKYKPFQDGDAENIRIKDNLNFRYKRQIFSNNNQLNELSRRILTSIEAALVAHEDRGTCLRRELCENNRYSRELDDNGKIWIPVWSLGMSWLSGRLVKDIPPAASMLDSLKASILGLGKAKCEVIYKECDLNMEKMKGRVGKGRDN